MQIFHPTHFKFFILHNYNLLIFHPKLLILPQVDPIEIIVCGLSKEEIKENTD